MLLLCLCFVGRAINGWTIYLKALSLTVIKSIGADWVGNLEHSTSEFCFARLSKIQTSVFDLLNIPCSVPFKVNLLKACLSNCVHKTTHLSNCL